MAEWIFDQYGFAGVILDDYCIRRRDGAVIAWAFGRGVYGLGGEHVGWLDDGVLYDRDNCVLGFAGSRQGLSLVTPVLMTAPAMPPFSPRPSTPRLQPNARRPEAGGWSTQALESYFGPCQDQQALHVLRYHQHAHTTEGSGPTHRSD